MSAIDEVLGARNITMSGGMLEVGDKNLTVDPSGEFRSEREIGANSGRSGSAPM